MYKSLYSLVFSLFLFSQSLVSYSQKPGKAELFQSLQKQETTMLEEYIRLGGDLKVVDKDSKGLVYVAVDSWNLPALKILLENRAPFRAGEMSKMLQRKLKMGQGLSISEENLNSHDKVLNYIQPFDEYQLVKNKDEQIDKYVPELLPPPYRDLRMVFNRAKIQYDLLLLRSINSGFDGDLGSSGFSVGAGVNIPLLKRYETRIITGDPDIRVNKSTEGKTIYFDDVVFLMEQVDMKQDLRHRFSMSLNMMVNYSKRKTGQLEASDFFTDITSDPYFLDIRDLDILPSLLFTYGSLYLKTGLELRANLSAELNWPADAAEADLLSEAVEDRLNPLTAAMVAGIGVELQWAYVEICRTIIAGDAFMDSPGQLHWLGLNIGLRL